MDSNGEVDSDYICFWNSEWVFLYFSEGVPLWGLNSSTNDRNISEFGDGLSLFLVPDGQ